MRITAEALRAARARLREFQDDQVEDTDLTPEVRALNAAGIDVEDSDDLTAMLDDVVRGLYFDSDEEEQPLEGITRLLAQEDAQEFLGAVTVGLFLAQNQEA